MRNLAFACSASLLLPVRHPLGRDLAIGVLRQVYKSHSGFSLYLYLWLVGYFKLVLLLASRFVIFSVRVHAVGSAISAKRNNEMVTDAEKSKIL
jgi:hypothetical protein